MDIGPEVRTKVLKLCSVDTRSSQNFTPDQVCFPIRFVHLKVRQAHDSCHCLSQAIRLPAEMPCSELFSFHTPVLELWLSMGCG